MTLERFLSLWAGRARFAQHRKTWVEHLGHDLVGALVDLGVLESEGPAEWYPCGGDCAGEALRRVVREPGREGLLAVCGAGGVCLYLELTDEDVEILAVSPRHLASRLREALGAAGKGFQSRRHPTVHGLGLVHVAEEREAVLVTGVSSAQLEPLVDELARTGMRWLLLVATWAAVPSDLRLRTSGGPVAFASLEALLQLQAGRLSIRVELLYRPAPPSPLEVREVLPAPPGPGLAPALPAATVCVVHDQQGCRELTAGDYQALVARAAELDLFIDATVTTPSGGHPVVRRDSQGKTQKASLSRNATMALARLITTRKALRAGEFADLRLQQVGKLIQRARRTVEDADGRRGWTAFQTLGGSGPAMQWQFNPPASFRFALVLPLGS